MHGVAGPVAAEREGWVLWGSELSPFALKVELLLRFTGVSFRWMPAGASFFEALRFERRRRQLVAGRLPLTWPRMTELDEFPLVPFLFGPAGENLYDSSAIAEWLDAYGPRPNRHATPFLPADAPALHFAVRLVDEACDEFGLYLAHHNRWVVSVRDTDAGARLAREMRPLLGPFAPLLGRRFAARQTRRLPYLFSVAAPDGSAGADLPLRLRPPARTGFPPTHELLEHAFSELLRAVEPVLSARSFLFGQRFTLADASLYGQLGMNRTDPSARAWIARQAPATQAWVDRLAAGDFGGHQPEGRLVLDAALVPAFAWTCRAFVPLMQQNCDAWERHRAAGETGFNEAAFDRGRALYDGMLLGRPFRSVVKTFQVRVWRDLRREWDALGAQERTRLESLLPAAHGLDRDGAGTTAAHPPPTDAGGAS